LSPGNVFSWTVGKLESWLGKALGPTLVTNQVTVALLAHLFSQNFTVEDV